MTQRVNVQLWPEPLSPTSTWNEHVFSGWGEARLGMADHLACLGVTRVVMEATSDYWKPVFYLLEAAGFETWLVNAKDVKHLPGRPKTDLDAAWLAKVAERQMLRPSFVPPPQIRRLRDLTRYRALCRHRHSCRYAEARIMPMLGRRAWLRAVIGVKASA